MSYANQTSVEGVLGRSLTTNEVAALPLLLSAVDSFINSQTGRTFGAAAESTRYYDTEDSKMLDVDPFVISEDVTEGDTTTPTARPFEVFYVDADENKLRDVDASDFEARPRNEIVKTYLQKRNGRWGSGCPANVANIAVKAFFGGGAVPDDIKYAASWLAAQGISAQLGMSLGLKSESIEGYSRTFIDATKTEQGAFLTKIFDKYYEVLI
jgi:hypothetical protein